MALLHTLRHRSADMLDDAADAIRPPRPMMRRPAGIGGVVLLIALALGFVWLFPELRRYIRIERM